MPSERILISRTDSIGDVMLTLPMCGIIKKHRPESTILFLGKSYTEDIIHSCIHVDEFINWDRITSLSGSEQVGFFKSLAVDTIIHVFPRKEIMYLARQASIPNRIATAGRLHTWKTCNHRIWFSRKRSLLHESQLNLKLLAGIGVHEEPDLAVMPQFYGFRPTEVSLPVTPDPTLFNVIIHPLSQGSAINWSLTDFRDLVHQLNSDRIRIYVTGTEKEGRTIQEQLPAGLGTVIDVTGKFNLSQLICFISKCDLLVAASTGPLHIAAATGIHAIGLYLDRRPIHPGRWSPVGAHVHVISAPDAGVEYKSLPITVEEVRTAIQKIGEETGKLH